MQATSMSFSFCICFISRQRRSGWFWAAGEVDGGRARLALPRLGALQREKSWESQTSFAGGSWCFFFLLLCCRFSSLQHQHHVKWSGLCVNGRLFSHRMIVKSFEKFDEMNLNFIKNPRFPVRTFYVNIDKDFTFAFWTYLTVLRTGGSTFNFNFITKIKYKKNTPKIVWKVFNLGSCFQQTSVKWQKLFHL